MPAAAKRKERFTPEMDERLVLCTQQYRANKRVQWSLMAREEPLFRGMSSSVLFQRFNRVLLPKRRLRDAGTWTEESDVKLVLAVREHGRKWSYISKQVFDQSYCDVKCRYGCVHNNHKTNQQPQNNKQNNLVLRSTTKIITKQPCILINHETITTHVDPVS